MSNKTLERGNTVQFLESSLWSPEFGLLQRYLPFNEDMSMHAHAGNGPWFQYTGILAQYYYFMGNRDRGDEILSIMDQYQSEDGYLPEHVSSCERFWEFIRTEWETGNDARKEFDPEILLPNLSYDLIVEELVNMKKSYDGIIRGGGGAGIAPSREAGRLSSVSPPR